MNGLLPHVRARTQNIAMYHYPRDALSGGHGKLHNGKGTRKQGKISAPALVHVTGKKCIIHLSVLAGHVSEHIRGCWHEENCLCRSRRVLIFIYGDYTDSTIIILQKTFYKGIWSL